ncbi:DUF5050 domain-containing protein [Lysinibacillus piscis]|uniref:Transglutaminase-like domain-containing protein n=1 Tax=Lysinibacillus piscis TaxID=2518931 RepID=A0ABQ5NN64_9BACI|nr:DUF5050 domain-containing protein [Lysinibacillus sp. KH24]GLC89816.1 hypothetical protein LYSBPC_29430 [Lysinibacillus sp. KH24]
MKQIKWTFLLLFCLTPLLVSCSEAIDSYLEEEEVAPTTKEEVKTPDSKALSASFSADELFSTTLFKDDPALLQFTRKVEKQIAQFNKTFDVTYTGKLEWEQFEQQLNDINSLLSYVDPYTAGYFLNYDWEAWEDKDGYLVEFQITYLTDAKKEKKVDAFVQAFAEDYITEDMTDLQRAKAVNDYVVQLATYTEAGSTEGQSVYELISEETAVCQAYALLAYRLFLEAGLNANYVYGYSDDELHAWNLVEVDNHWYHVDTTWNDIDPSEPYAITYEYFLVNDETLSKDHLWKKENYFAATNNDYDFIHDMWYADTADDVIYYNSIADNMLYSYDLTTQQRTQISETACYYLAVEDDAIYCSDYDNLGYLTKIAISDGAEEVLIEEEVLNLYIVDDILYYDTLEEENFEITL